jgi:translocation and assembly module TamA
MIRVAALLVLVLASAGCAGEKAEGRPWVRRLSFDGVKQVSVRDLRNKLAVQKTPWLGFPRHYLDEFTVEVDRARIEAFYRAHGFFGARVLVAEATPVKGGKAVDVTFKVDEGEPTKVVGFDLSGLPDVTQKAKLEKRQHERIKVGATLVHQDYMDAKQKLEDRLKQLGFAWAEVDGRVEVNRDTREARVIMTVKPGPLAHFGHVHVHNLPPRVSEHEVALHAGIKPGAKFDPEAIEAARGKIYALGVFSSVRVEYVHGDDDPAMADVIVTVSPGTLNELRLGLGTGFESQRTDVHASVIYSRRNFLGHLRTLRLRLEPGWVAIPAFWDVQRTGPAILADATLTQPDWPLPLATTRFTVGYDVGIEYAYQYHGPRTSLSVTRGFWNDHILLGLSYNFQFLAFFNTDPTFQSAPNAGRLFGYTNPYWLGWLQEDIALDLRDKPLDAHQGVYLGTSLEQGGIWVGGAFEYQKISPDLRAYAPFGRRVTFATRVQFGQMFVQGNMGSPITRRFYLGGPNSHRGFNYNRLSLQVPSGIPGVAPLPIGGDQMFLIQNELRVNVFRLFGQWFSLCAFVDGGDVSAPNCGNAPCADIPPGIPTTINYANLYWAVGPGLRYKTIIGTIRFDLGIRLNRLTQFEPDGAPNADPGQRFAFHLSVGEAF